MHPYNFNSVLIFMVQMLKVYRTTDPNKNVAHTKLGTIFFCTSSMAVCPWSSFSLEEWYIEEMVYEHLSEIFFICFRW